MANTASGGACATASPKSDADIGSFKIIYLAVARQAILGSVLEVEGALAKAETLSRSPEAPKNVRCLAKDFVAAHKYYQVRLSHELTQYREAPDAETRWIAWNLGPLLGSQASCAVTAPKRITNEFLVQAKDPTADRLFDERTEAYKAFREGLAKESVPASKSAGGERRQGFLSGLLGFVR